MKHIYAYTESLTTPGLPAYVNLSEREEGRPFITVRNRYANSLSEIEVGDKELEALAHAITCYIVKKRIQERALEDRGVAQATWRIVGEGEA